MKNINFFQKAIFGAIGSVAPDILLLYSKRWTMSDLVFDPIQYAIASFLYIVLSATVAAVFPYRGRSTAMKAMGIGLSLPIILASAASAVAPHVVSPRGGSLSGNLLDLISLF